MEVKTIETTKEARLVMMELANMISVPMSLNAVVNLKVADAIWQGGDNTPLTPAEIMERVPFKSGDAANLKRILRMLVSYNVFTEYLDGSDPPERKYSLTDVGKTLVTDSDGLSYGAYVLQHHQDAMMKAWNLVHEAVLDPTKEPFVVANGETAYSYYGKHPELNQLMQDAMSGLAVPFMNELLATYKGFEGVKKLVDVGGSSGECLRLILEKHLDITEGINFDLPEVVAKAPVIPRVTHVGGDMFEYVPSGDGIFMRWILTTWTDEECKVILDNCYKAIPVGAKMTVCEPVMPKESDDSNRTRALLAGDIFVMTIYRALARPRTEDDYKKLFESAGFSGFKTEYQHDYFHAVMQCQK